MSPKKVRAVFARFAQANPNPTTELEYRTPYQLLVAVILSAQATDKSVNLATRELFKTAGTPQKMARLGEAGLAPYISRIGLYKSKAKNVVRLNTVFGEPTIAVDTHVFRLANRSGLAPGKDVREVEEKLLKAVPAEYRHNAHHWLILHGRYVCKALRPDCPHCLINDLCEWPEKTAG